MAPKSSCPSGSGAHDAQPGDLEAMPAIVWSQPAVACGIRSACLVILDLPAATAPSSHRRLVLNAARAQHG
jgi:hypothetical protein